MSSNQISDKSKEEIKAARQAKKLAKQKVKDKDIKNNEQAPATTKAEPTPKIEKPTVVVSKQQSPNKNTGPQVSNEKIITQSNVSTEVEKIVTSDEVDRAVVTNTHNIESDKSKDMIKAERAAKKAEKQSKRMVAKEGKDLPVVKEVTAKNVVETLKEITNVAKDIQDIAAKPEEVTKSKAELKAERRAKQEAQRAAKQGVVQKKEPKPMESLPTEVLETKTKEKSPKPKTLEKPKSKVQIGNKINWFQHLSTDHEMALKKLVINSNLHPAIVKLGVQLSARTVTGSNACCVALLNALKRMVADYKLPAKTEYARGLEAHLAASLSFLWAMRQPTASQTNAVKFFRYHLTQLPNNVEDFEAKKTLQEEIDRYITEQIDMAGKAISLAVRNKISNNDNILTYGWSSLVERILREAWDDGLRFRVAVAGRAGGELLRRLAAHGLPAAYVDVTALSFAMKHTNKVLVGAEALLVNGSVLAPLGTAQVALVAKQYNVPVLVACETHKFSERVQTDAFVYNELGDPDDLIKDVEDSPLKDWRSNPNLTLLNLTYDVTPASLVTAVVTELAILPCTSAPVVLRFKLSEYGI